jgi:hypothetical protein
MRQRLFASVGVLTVLSLTAMYPAAQSSARGTTGSAVKKTAVPRAPDGKPDLQGIWDFRTVTPLERPAEFAGKATLTEAEAAEFERKAVAARNADENREKTGRGNVNGTPVTADVALAYNDFWWDRGTKVVGTRRTSLIVDPPDGKLPPLTPQATERLRVLEARRERAAEGPEDRSVGERCLMGFNAGPPITTGGYNQNLQIVQTKDHVMLMTEMVHTARIVPLDNRPQSNVPAWTGTSRGRWEGETLVIETKNFRNETSLRGSSPSLHLTERFTRVDGDMLMYEYTVNDPKTWTKPWTVQVPMQKSDDMIYEYACHEANYGMTNLLKAARAIEKGFADDPGGAR